MQLRSLMSSIRRPFQPKKYCQKEKKEKKEKLLPRNSSVEESKALSFRERSTSKQIPERYKKKLEKEIRSRHFRQS